MHFKVAKPKERQEEAHVSFCWSKLRVCEEKEWEMFRIYRMRMSRAV